LRDDNGGKKKDMTDKKCNEIQQKIKFPVFQKLQRTKKGDRGAQIQYDSQIVA